MDLQHYLHNVLVCYKHFPETFSLLLLLGGEIKFVNSCHTVNKKSNLSLNLGLGAIVLSHIQLHVNYNIPMGKTSEWSGFNGVTGGLTDLITDSKTNTLQVSAAYLF